MRHRLRLNTPIAVLLLLCVSPSLGSAAPTVARCVLEGTVDAGSAAYLRDCVGRAEAGGHAALLVRMDTPGGALESTREIVQALLGAKVPVLVWVGPAGARAGSAGVFLALASHLTAMAPGTNIGAAHPVVGPTGADPEEAGGKEMARKVESDAAAFAEAIARQRGRNAEWAVQAVRESASVAADKAVELKVVELVAASEEELLSQADGRKVMLPQGEQELATRGATLVDFSPTLGQALVHALASPAIAYLLFLVGGMGIAIELSHPGLIAPGLIGAVCLILAMVAFSALPIRTGAVALLILGVALLVSELFVTSGLLGAGGLLLLVLGGLLLVDRFDPRWYVEPSFGLTLRLILPTVVALGGAASFVVARAAYARHLPQRGGAAGLVGEQGTALTLVTPEGGEVFVHGERWRAHSPKPIPQGARVTVREVDGLTLRVEEVST